MKQLHYVLLGCTFVFLTLFACLSKPTEKTDTSKTISHRVLAVQDTISLQKFDLWKNNWAAHGQQWSCDNRLDYFQMPLIDLAQTLGEQPIAGRYYMGLDMSTKPYTPHILLVGVNEQQLPMIDYRQGNYVYDVSRPCPPDCEKSKK